MADNLLMIQAEEILKKIEKGKPVEYENIIIFGDLDLYRLDLPLDKDGRKVVNSIIKIEYSVIKGDVFFDHSTFSGLVDFDCTVFSQRANFSDSQFCEDAGFSEAQFQGEASFFRAKFLTEANFSRARFGGDADFGNAGFENSLNLENAKSFTIRLSHAHFGTDSNIYLRDLDFNRIIVRWNSIKDHFPFNGSVYLAMIKNFRNLEQFEDADSCYYQYRKEKQNRSMNSASKLLDYMAWISCGYGVRPSHTIALSMTTILLFTSIFWSGGGIRFDAAALQGHTSTVITLRDAFYFSSMEFIGRTPQNLTVIGGYEYLIVIETLLGWALMALLLITLSKVMLR